MDIGLAVIAVLLLALGVYQFRSVITQPVVAVLTIPAGAMLVALGAVWVFWNYLAGNDLLSGGSFLFPTSPLSLMVIGSAAMLAGLIGIVRCKLRRRRSADDVK